eukprot:6924954-Prymnesium_polylepis.1
MLRLEAAAASRVPLPMAASNGAAAATMPMMSSDEERPDPCDPNAVLQKTALPVTAATAATRTACDARRTVP